MQKATQYLIEKRSKSGTFENKRSCDMNAFGVYGKTVQRSLYEGDDKKRYIHIYHSISKEVDEREKVTVHGQCHLVSD